MICEDPIKVKCKCGKSSIEKPCYMKNYPIEKRRKLMPEEEIEAIDNFECKKICKSIKSCKTHKCMLMCCDVKKGIGRAGDPDGKHLCTLNCGKMLGCALHPCPDFCHLGYCKPCKYISTVPLYCPCNIAKLDPPIKCGEPAPSCGGPCLKKLPCGHDCSLKCHTGNCPPCLVMVERPCNCGKDVKTGIFCHKSDNLSCGAQCKEPLSCGHTCTKNCHLPGKCFVS